MKAYKGFKTELDPSNKQRSLLAENAGAARWAFNWGLEKIKSALDAGQKPPHWVELSRELTQLKRTEAPWLKACSDRSPRGGLRNLDAAMGAFWQGRKKGLKVGFPKFRSRRRRPGSFRIQGAVRVFDRAVQLPKIGKVRLKEAGYLPVGAKVDRVTVSEQGGRWFVSVSVEMDIPESPTKPEESTVGVDLGIKTLATSSDGVLYDHPKRSLKKLDKRMRRLQRSIGRKRKGSSNYRKASDKAARLYRRIANTRKDTLHKVTSNLTRTKSVVVIEDLNVAGMVKNRCLARAISEMGFGEFRRQLEYKGKWYGCQVIVADRFYPSSKRCSACGEINKELKLSDREWTCAKCGTTHDRDFNAARNLEFVAARSTETQNACGGEGLWFEVNASNETRPDEAGIEQEAKVSLSL